MRIVIPGGSGQIGTLLAGAFQREGHDVVVLSRRPQVKPWRVMTWDGAALGPWTEALDGCDVVINLAGRSVNCRYTGANQQAMLDSRVNSTRVIGRAIAQAARPPRVWLQASTATIYAHRYDAPNDEASGTIGGDEPDAPESWRFSIEVARAWEQTLSETPLGLPANRWMLELGAACLRTDTELVLKSRRVVPARLLAGGFRFRYPRWGDAARDLVAQWRAAAA